MSVDKRPPLLLKVLAAMGGLDIQEAHIEGKPSEQIYGLQEGKRIWINPTYSTVSTLIHEVLHSMNPDWDESYVRNRESYLMNRLTEDEIRHLYTLYIDRVKVRRKGKKIA